MKPPKHENKPLSTPNLVSSVHTEGGEGVGSVAPNLVSQPHSEGNTAKCVDPKLVSEPHAGS